MALNTFGWSGAEVIEDKSTGRVVAGVSLTVYTDITKTTQVTALYGKDGTALGSSVLVSDSRGRFGFKADESYSVLYVWDGTTEDPWPVVAREALSGTAYTPANPVLSVSYNTDGSVASTTENGVTTTFTYNSDGTVNTQTRAGVTRTFTYSNGNVTGAA